MLAAEKKKILHQRYNVITGIVRFSNNRRKYWRRIIIRL